MLAEKIISERDVPLIKTPRWLMGILGLALVVFVAGLCVNPVPAADLFWQMRTGREILASHHVPQVDTHSWTRYGSPWVAHEWGMCVLLYAIFHSAGYGGVWLLQFALVAATALLLFKFLWRETGGTPLVAFALAVLGMLGASPMFQPRPHLFSYLFLTIFVGVALDARRHAERRTRLWLLVPLAALWANLHGGVIVGIGLLAVFALGDGLESLLLPRDDPRRRALWTGAKQLMIVALACAAATLLNPYGGRLFQIFGRTVGDSTMPDFVSEWASMNFHGGMGFLTEALAAVFLLCFFFSRERRGLADALILLLLAHETVYAVRNLPLFALAGVLICARHARSAIDVMLARFSAGNPPSLFGIAPPPAVAVLVAALFGYVGVLHAVVRVKRAPRGGSLLARIARASFVPEYFPERGCRFLQAERFPTDMRLYNDYDIGAYLTWHVPQYPVFVSTQTDVFFGRVLQDYAKVENFPLDWRNTLAPYHPDLVFTRVADRQSRLFLTAPEWALVYADDPNLGGSDPKNTLIFVRRNAKYLPLIARCHRDCPAFARGSHLAEYSSYAALR